ncbi:MAG: hypothetical protein V3U04_08030 [Candidatus Aerophobetes bacterium]
MTHVYVPKEQITARPLGWNEEGTSTENEQEDINGEGMTSIELAKLARAGHSFDFLSDSREDIYSLTDGESIE